MMMAEKMKTKMMTKGKNNEYEKCMKKANPYKKHLTVPSKKLFYPNDKRSSSRLTLKFNRIPKVVPPHQNLIYILHFAQKLSVHLNIYHSSSVVAVV